jgi:hypothetical protein
MLAQVSQVGFTGDGVGAGEHGHVRCGWAGEVDLVPAGAQAWG